MRHSKEQNIFIGIGVLCESERVDGDLQACGEFNPNMS